MLCVVSIGNGARAIEKGGSLTKNRARRFFCTIQPSNGDDDDEKASFLATEYTSPEKRNYLLLVYVVCCLYFLFPSSSSCLVPCLSRTVPRVTLIDFTLADYYARRYSTCLFFYLPRSLQSTQKIQAAFLSAIVSLFHRTDTPCQKS